jgi:hypothetical protein
LGHFFGAFFGSAIDDYLRPLPSKRPRQGFANTLARSGNYRDSTLELHPIPPLMASACLIA